MPKFFTPEKQKPDSANCDWIFDKSNGYRYALIGPQGIGKSKHSTALASALGVTRILDDGYDWPDDLKSAFVANTLLINNAFDHDLADGKTILFEVRSEEEILEVITALRLLTA